MKAEHNVIRKKLCGMGKPEAKRILQTYLPDREYYAIYLCDLEQKSLSDIGDDDLHCSESMVKKIRKSGFEKLTASWNFD